MAEIVTCCYCHEDFDTESDDEKFWEEAKRDSNKKEYVCSKCMEMGDYIMCEECGIVLPSGDLIVFDDEFYCCACVPDEDGE